MKLWFVEPRANVFVSGVKDYVATTVIEYLYQHCPEEAGVTIFRSLPKPPGYEIRQIGVLNKEMVEISGLQLIIEKTKQT